MILSFSLMPFLADSVVGWEQFDKINADFAVVVM